MQPSVDAAEHSIEMQLPFLAHLMKTRGMGEGLRKWVVEGLGYIVQLAGMATDGPLGWTTDQHVFAVCARVVMCEGVGGERGWEWGGGRVVGTV